jgi:hypothetical protein
VRYRWGAGPTFHSPKFALTIETFYNKHSSASCFFVRIRTLLEAIRLPLENARAVLVGGGWLGRPNGPSELEPFIDHALAMVGTEAAILNIPTPGDPGDDPAEEIAYFRAAIQGRPGVRLLEVGSDGSWPDYEALAGGITEANFITIQGGNFAEFLQLAGSPEDSKSIASLLVAKFYSGEAVFLGSSTGTGCWAHAGFSADRDWTRGGGVYPYFRPVPAWNVIPAEICVHYNERHTQGDGTGVFRGAKFQELMELDSHSRAGVGIGVDTQAAVVLNGDGTMCVMSRDPYAHVQILRSRSAFNPMRGDHVASQIIKPGGEPIPISRILASAS